MCAKFTIDCRIERTQVALVVDSAEVSVGRRGHIAVPRLLTAEHRVPGGSVHVQGGPLGARWKREPTAKSRLLVEKLIKNLK